MNNNKTLAIALAALFTTSLAFAEVEVSGKITIENSSFLTKGSTIGNAGKDTITGAGSAGNYQGVTRGDTPTNDFGKLKNDISVRVYADGDVMDGVTFHAEVQGFGSASETGGFGGKSSGYGGEYTQNAGMRELYVDITAGDGYAARLGKQQVVWGTADGMKLLDIVNPTDYAEMAQNQMEDSRVPVFALNLEKGNHQVVVSQPKENVFAGLNRGTNTDVRQNNAYLDDTTLDGGTNTGNAYMMMGPDSITGQRNGFLNIVPDLGSVASRFAMAFTPDGTTGIGSSYNGALATQTNLTNPGMEGFVVGTSASPAGTTFASMTMAQMNTALGGQAFTGAWDATAGNNFVDADGDPSNGAGIAEGFERAIYNTAKALNNTTTPTNAQINAVTGAQMLDSGFAPLYNTNLSSFKDGNADSAFEYMGNTTFRTFDTFGRAKSQYVYNMPKGDDADFAFKTSQTTKSGVNYSLNFSNSYDKNPVINLSWRGDTGQELSLHKVKTSYDGTGAATTSYDANAAGGVKTSIQLYDAATATIPTSGSGNKDVDFMSGTGVYGSGAKVATLQFEQSVVKTKNLGASFDTSFESPSLGPVVIRGEALYTMDGKQPVMNKDKLSIGDLVGALSMQDADRFKFVLGADITVLTNMMISAQYISDRNLDFKDNGGEYTTDYATMHLSNGFNKAIKDKQFYSLFFSKPFGASGQNRWNNIFMSEEGVGENGYWNRFDVDYGLTDDVSATVEINTYGGNTNTQFGQLDKSDNMQVGVKYTF